MYCHQRRVVMSGVSNLEPPYPLYESVTTLLCVRVYDHPTLYTRLLPLYPSYQSVNTESFVAVSKHLDLYMTVSTEIATP